MKKLAAIAIITAALTAPAGVAAAAPAPATAATTPVAASAVSSSEDIFCAVLKFLKGGWAGRPADCTF